jgi:hypothetical protein
VTSCDNGTELESLPTQTQSFQSIFPEINTFFPKYSTEASPWKEIPDWAEFRCLHRQIPRLTSPFWDEGFRVGWRKVFEGSDFIEGLA